MPVQLSACQSRNDPVATGCKHAYSLERMFLFLEVLRPMHVGFISKFSSSAGGWARLHLFLFWIRVSSLIHFRWDMFWSLVFSCHQSGDFVSHWGYVIGTKCVRAAFTVNLVDYKYRLFFKITASWYSATLRAVVVCNANSELNVFHVLRHVVKCLFSRFFCGGGMGGSYLFLNCCWIVVVVIYRA